ncbi:aminomethyl transferase family protein [Chelativorans sp. SCAU2101]|jgi:Glycine cleavage system T protein (aminomethyltransferase)|uniref:Aminomethyl transferase family protein n=1 Tax=Chelativorans petroleitrophicus TaxID=2975484 RepID=A0A9X3BA49_9HYPH|nr:aminomethyl transferase family protein [Chelativorans petroleitrophicus]MCT8991356.1 aminomethyl transferase family protein [Chelativorans petroleitrophicus]
MANSSLEAVLREKGNIVQMLRNSKIGIYVYPVVAAEFSNWRDEQRAWRESAVLFDQSHHMDELIVEGPDAAKLLEGLAINSFANFDTNRAKHFVPVSPEGYVIGDMIAFREERDKFVLVGRAPTANWVQYNASLGKHDVKVTRDPRSPSNPDGKEVRRVHYRFQIQGPEAPKVLEKLNGGPLPEIKFFHVDWINIAGRRVRALRHGMAGAPGLEIWGPYDEKDEVRAAILKAAQEAGVDLRPVGSRAYSTNTLESGWIPSPLPAIYTGEELKGYREWLGADSYEAVCSIGGSFVSDDIRDYYTTPYELGYGMYVKFDHDFVGRAALEKMHGKPHRKKVTFEWNAEDLLKVIESSLRPGELNAKWIDFPQPNYASSGFDRVMMGDRLVGLSMFNGFSFNERAMLSLGIVDPDINVGDVLTLVWGEPEATAKTSTERHRQAEIRVRVSPTPYARQARESYAEGWRTRQNA